MKFKGWCHKWLPSKFFSPDLAEPVLNIYILLWFVKIFFSIIGRWCQKIRRLYRFEDEMEHVHARIKI